MAELQRLATLLKNGREQVVIAISEYKGVRYVDCRTFATNTNAECVPTPKGVGLRPTMLRPAIEALEEAERLLIADGTIKHGGRAHG